MAEIRNILLIGRTGSGKSTLANTLIGENKFEESAKSISASKHVEEGTFEVSLDNDGNEKIKYRVLDTIGIGDTNIPPQGVLTRLAEMTGRVKKEGLNRILFVTKGRFTKEEIEAYDLLVSIIFSDKDEKDNSVIKHITVVRTDFPDFEDSEVCDDDRGSLRMENKKLTKILNNVDIIYVDNPPLKGRNSKSNKEIREESRKRILTYLGQFRETYRPKCIDTLEERIEGYKTNEEKLQEKLDELEVDRKRQEEEFRKQLADSKEELIQQLRKNIVEIQEQKEQNLTLSQKSQIQEAFENKSNYAMFKTGVVDVVEKDFFSTALKKNFAVFMYHSKATVGLAYAFAVVEYKFDNKEVKIISNTKYPDSNVTNFYMRKKKAHTEMERVINDIKNGDDNIKREVIEEQIQTKQGGATPPDN